MDRPATGRWHTHQWGEDYLTESASRVVQPEPEPVEPEHEVVRCAGLCSQVPEGDSSDTDTTHGHVVMLDHDDTDSIMQVLTDLDRTQGVTALLESSPGSYHGYGFALRPLAEQVTHALRCHGEAAHVRQSARRGYFVLRWSAKLYTAGPQEGEAYKEAPTLEQVMVPDTLEQPHSRPHLEAMLEQAEADGRVRLVERLEGALDRLESQDLLRGSVLTVDRYESGTDRLKALAGSGE